MQGAPFILQLRSIPQLTGELRRTPHTVAEFLEQLRDYAIDRGPRVIGILLISAIAWWAVRGIARRLAGVPVERDGESRTLAEQRAKTAAELVRNAGHFLIAVIALLSIANSLDLQIGPFLASAGVLGLAISFGSQSLVRDFVTGFFLQLEQQFVLGETVRVGLFEGTVERVTLRLVYLRDATGALHIIPNGSIAQVTNLSRTWGRVVVDVDISWDDSDRAGEVLGGVASDLAKAAAWDDALLEVPKLTGIEKLAGGVVTYRLIARVIPSRRDEVARELRYRVKRALDVAKIRAASPLVLASAV